MDEKMRAGMERRIQRNPRFDTVEDALAAAVKRASGGSSTIKINMIMQRGDEKPMLCQSKDWEIAIRLGYEPVYTDTQIDAVAAGETLTEEEREAEIDFILGPQAAAERRKRRGTVTKAMTYEEAREQTK